MTLRLLCALALALTACTNDYGTLIIVEGDAIEFDQIELYFGKEIGERTPTTPGRVQANKTETQRLTRRLLSEFDQPSPFRPRTQWTNYLPPGDENRGLGDYVLVVASMGGRTVGLAELFYFELPDDEVRQYKVHLVAPSVDGFERWDRNTDPPRCVRWTRDRGPDLPTTVAVVPEDDADCDGFLDSAVEDADCEPLVYCPGDGSEACYGQAPCSVDAFVDGCSIGTCVNSDTNSRKCDETLCVPMGLCECKLDKPLLTLAECTLERNDIHYDWLFPLEGGVFLCSEPYTFDVRLTIRCANPVVEEAVNYNAGPIFDYSIQSSPNDANTCLLTIKPRAPRDPFSAIPHIILSVDTPGLPLRTAFAIGLSGTKNLACPGEGIDVDVIAGVCAP